jgi:hypothetical protein
MEWYNTLQEIQKQWAVSGFSLIISDPEQTALFWYHIRQKYECTILQFPTNVSEFSTWTAELSQSFLGATRVYWCSIPAAGAKNSKVRQQAIQFLKQYGGPHTVWTVVAEEQGSEYSGCRRFVVPAIIRGSESARCAQLLGMERSEAVLDALQLIPARSSLSLDVVIQLLVHAGYVPMRRQAESTAFLQTLLPHDVTLQHIAELFFKEDWPLFFEKWALVSGMYSDMFWISFWSEQCWRAYWVCWYMQRGQQTRARGMSYRLPQFFMQTGWQKTDLETLRVRYESIAWFDTRVKHGSFFSINEVMMRLL